MAIAQHMHASVLWVEHGVPGSDCSEDMLLPADHYSNCFSPKSGQHQATAAQRQLLGNQDSR